MIEQLPDQAYGSDTEDPDPDARIHVAIIANGHIEFENIIRGTLDRVVRRYCGPRPDRRIRQWANNLASSTETKPVSAVRSCSDGVLSYNSTSWGIWSRVGLMPTGWHARRGSRCRGPDRPAQ